MNYIIAVVEGPRHDLAPEYTGKAKVFKYGSFNLLVWYGGDYEAKEYEEEYERVSDYLKRINNEFKGSRWVKGLMKGEMLTPKERSEYNDIYCYGFHNWLVQKMLTSDEIIVSKINVYGKDLHERIDVYSNLEEVAKIARVVSGEMLKWIHTPGSYYHNMMTKSEDTIWEKDYPIFELGWTLPYSIQIIDKKYHFKG